MGRRVFGILVIGLGLAAVGAFLAAGFSPAANICSGVASVFASGRCFEDRFIELVGDGVFAVGVVIVSACVVLAAVRSMRADDDAGKHLTAQGWGAPGWYQPEPGSPMRWWDGRRWGAWWTTPAPPREEEPQL